MNKFQYEYLISMNGKVIFRSVTSNINRKLKLQFLENCKDFNIPSCLGFEYYQYILHVLNLMLGRLQNENFLTISEKDYPPVIYSIRELA